MFRERPGSVLTVLDVSWIKMASLILLLSQFGSWCNTSALSHKILWSVAMRCKAKALEWSPLFADKGNTTVVMDQEQYDKMRNLLDDIDCRSVKKDPTTKLEKKIKEALNEMENKGNLPTPLKKRLNPSNSVIPQIYGLPKLHKEGVPLRPIVCTIGSPTYHLAKELCRILTPLLGTRTHT